SPTPGTSAIFLFAVLIKKATFKNSICFPLFTLISTNMEKEQFVMQSLRSLGDRDIPKCFDGGKTNGCIKFFGNTAAGRIVRATTSSTVNVVNSVLYLSPWGDLNPIVIANIRCRDALLFGMGLALGGVGIEATADLIPLDAVERAADFFLGGTAAGTVGKLLVFQVVEEALDEGFDKGNEVVRKGVGPRGKSLAPVGGSTTLKNLFVKIKTPFMGEKAVVEMRGATELGLLGCDVTKAWFVPYLESTGRTCLLKRSSSFGIAHMLGPAIRGTGDWHLALSLLQALPSLIRLSTIDSPLPDKTHGHLLIATVAISPYRGLWSQAKCPNSAKLMLRLLDQASGLVVPVKDTTPIISWSGITVKQMRSAPSGSQSVKDQCQLWSEFIKEHVEVERMQGDWEKKLVASIKAIAASWSYDQAKDGEWLNNVDLNRAGIVAFYY
ncbi:hypothetical protein D6D21_05047, partial [Aureobasidium pullulans]